MDEANFCVIVEHEMHREMEAKFVYGFGLTLDEARALVKRYRKPGDRFWIALAQEESDQALS